MERPAPQNDTTGATKQKFDFAETRRFLRFSALPQRHFRAGLFDSFDSFGQSLVERRRLAIVRDDQSI